MKPDRTHLLKLAEESTDYYWAMLKSFYGNIGPRPIVKMNARLKSTAGRAWIEENIVDFSVDLMAEFTAHFRKNTIPHELAHHVAYRKFNEANHGKPWKDVMCRMGVQPLRCHDYFERRLIAQIRRECK